MEESSTYQLIEERGARKVLTQAILKHGRLKCGEPKADQLTTLQGIEDLDRLEELHRRSVTATTWEELLS